MIAPRPPELSPFCRDRQSTRAIAAAPAVTVDLHTHSSYSDGVLTPTALVAEAARCGLRVLGLTDHDTVGGLAEAHAAATAIGVDLVPGVELSTGGGIINGQAWPEIHLLGYYIEPTEPNLLAGLATYARARLERLARMSDRLTSLGLAIDPDHVRRLAGPGTVGRPHIARALVEQGYVLTMAEAFDRYLSIGRPGFVPRPRVDPADGIALIRGAGGVAVLAHPLATGDIEAVVARLAPGGLSGIEVDYGEYDLPTRERLRTVAERWHLIATGGSDYHGPGFRAGRELGVTSVPEAAVRRLRAAAGRLPRAIAAL
jgi:hypothetical protein